MLAQRSYSTERPPLRWVSAPRGKEAGPTLAASQTVRAGLVAQTAQASVQQSSAGANARPWAMGGGTVCFSPRMRSAGPGAAVAVALSSERSRSLSQGSRVNVAAALSPRVVIQTTQPPTDVFQSGVRCSPRQRSLQRAPSRQPREAIAPASSGKSLATVVSAVGATTQEVQNTAQIERIRSSLLSDIESVQRELARLKVEQAHRSAHVGSQREAAVLPCSPCLSSRATPLSPERGRHVSRRQDPQTASSYRGTAGLAAASGSISTPLQQPAGAADIMKPANLSAARTAAALRIQRFWRRVSSNHLRVRGGRTRPAVHHAAARIQRAWRVSRWRRMFVDFSEREIGWVGSLAWLQQRSLLYGTELADLEDKVWWVQNHANAPLDREVDPWGFVKLRDHLNKMWFGRSTEELEQEQRLEELRLDEEKRLYMLYNVQQQWHMDPGHFTQRQAVLQLPEDAARLGVSASTLHQTWCHGELTAGAQCVGPLASSTGSGKAPSLSPRGEVLRVPGETACPGRSLVFGAAQPSSLLFRSPPQTHRATRAAVQDTAAAAAAAVAAQNQAVVAAASARRAPVTVWAHRAMSSSD